MNMILADVSVGRKNVIFGIVLFLILGVATGLPLTVDLFGGSMMTDTQYQAWKVLHAYGIFLAFINFFFGFLVDRMSLGSRPKEIASWAFVIAGVVGGLGRPALYLLSSTGGIGSYAISLIETLGFVLGTFLFLRNRVKEHPAH